SRSKDLCHRPLPNDTFVLLPTDPAGWLARSRLSSPAPPISGLAGMIAVGTVTRARSALRGLYCDPWTCCAVRDCDPSLRTDDGSPNRGGGSKGSCDSGD